MNILGIDVGGTKILGLRTDEYGTVLAQVNEPTRGDEGRDAVIDRIAAIIRNLTPPEGVDAIGIGMPGPLDPIKGEVFDPPNLPGWESVPLRKELQDRLGNSVPIVLVNDANAAALAEFRFGAGSEKLLGRKIKHLVYLTISTGVGGGVITDGKLLLGANGFATELGHIAIDAFGKRCNCGGIGCLEAMASGTAIAKEGAIVVISRRPSKISDLAEGKPENVTARLVVEAANQGDPIANEIMEQEGLLVGVGVVNCIHTFNPEVIVLGGGVTNAGDLLFKPVHATVESRVIPAYKGTFVILPAALKGESGALGAVAAALEELGGPPTTTSNLSQNT
ncbi:MAG: ROK family protein [Chloroflexota bacterium]